MKLNRWGRTSLHEDLRFWEAGVEHGDLLRRVGAALDLQILAIDYSDRADGSTVIWEANPYFNLNTTAFPHRGPRKLERRLRSYQGVLAGLLDDLASGHR